MGVQSVKPGPGDDPELVKEAWERHVNRKIALHGRTLERRKPHGPDWDLSRERRLCEDQNLGRICSLLE